MSWKVSLFSAFCLHVGLACGLVTMANTQDPHTPEPLTDQGDISAIEVVNVVRLIAHAPTQEIFPKQAVAPAKPSPKIKRPVATKQLQKPTPKAVSLSSKSIDEPKNKPLVSFQARPIQKVEKTPAKALPTPVKYAPSNTTKAAPSDVNTTQSSAMEANGSKGPTTPRKTLSKKAKRAQQKYLAELMGWLTKHKDYPAHLKKQKIQGTVKVRFSFLKNGEVTFVNVANSSNSAQLDAAAVNVLHRASPLPPIPKILEREKLTITLPIEYSLITK